MNQDDPIPPTEPVKKKAAPKAKAAGAASRIPGTKLVPDLESLRSSIETSYAYWVGVLPSCPVEHIDVAGINFPKLNEDVSRDDVTNSTRRVPRIGAIVRLTADKVKRIEHRLARTVIRFRPEPDQKNEPGTGENVSKMPHQRGRKGFLITIPTEEELRLRAERGLAARRYQQQPGDEPASRYMFAVLCENQAKPQQGMEYPEPLEVTGLEWPGDLTE